MKSIDSKFAVQRAGRRDVSGPPGMREAEEGAYDNGVFQSRRILNGDQTDWGLDFGSDSEVLRVSLARY